MSSTLPQKVIKRCLSPSLDPNRHDTKKLAEDELCVLADGFWAQCAELAAKCTAMPAYDEAKRAQLPRDCTRTRFGYFRFESECSCTRRDFCIQVVHNSLLSLTDAVRDDDDALIVVESATRAGIDDETFYELLGLMVVTWPPPPRQSYNDVYPFSNLVKKHPTVLATNAALMLACLNMGIEYGGNVMFSRELLAAVARTPEHVETRRVVDVLVDSSCIDVAHHTFAIRVLQRMRPRVLYTLGAAKRVAEMVQGATTSRRRLGAIERLIQRIEAPANMDMEKELGIALAHA